MKFACTNCGQHIEAENDWVGMESACPTCNVAFVVPTLKEAEASLVPPSPEPEPGNVPSETTHGFKKHTFISHSSRDHEYAARVCEILERYGLNCWIAPRDIAPGAPYDEEIMSGIECSKTFILLLSAASNESPHVKRELTCALRAGHDVYPIRIEDIQPGTKLEYLLGGIHWVDAWTAPIETHLHRLARLITGHNPNVESTPAASEHDTTVVKRRTDRKPNLLRYLMPWKK